MTVQGVVALPVEVRQVEASVMPLTEILVDDKALRSAKPGPGTAIELRSMMRKRSRVTGEPVLLVNRRRIDNVPNVALGSIGVKSRTRFGDRLALILASRSVGAMFMFLVGLLKFSGPGAPSR